MRKQVLRSLLAASMVAALGLFGCGAAPSTDAADEAEEMVASEGAVEEAATEEKAAEADAEPEEAPEDALGDEAFDGVALISNEYVEIDLQRLFQKRVNWTYSDGRTEETILNAIAITAENKTDGDALVFVHAYLDGEELWCMLADGHNDPKAGKKVNASYYIAWDTQPDFTQLDSFEQLYDVDLVITVASNEGGYPTICEAEVNLGEAIGAVSPE